MTWPLSQDYNEAIQCPSGSFRDPDLQEGEAVSSPLGIPMPCSGNFADVYELRCPSGNRWAVKCFTREVPGLRERYAAISRHLAQAHLPFIVDFTFLEQGIRVRGRWYPIVKMQWVEGLTLNAFVRQYVDNPSMLMKLLQLWVRMAARLRGVGIAHADLQHGNVLLVPGLAANALVLKLVDYDGMFVPALAGSNSGEVGHPCYQHPQRLAERAYNRELDRFPLLLIATALACIQVGGRSLWDKYDCGENLLFREADLQAPVKSRLFYELLKLPDARASRLVRQTLDALTGRLEVAPLLEELLPELHAPSAARPAVATMPKQASEVKAVEAQTAATNSASPWGFQRADDAPSRRRRKGGIPSWLWVTVGAGMAALVGSVFVPARWNTTKTPKDEVRSTQNQAEIPSLSPGKSSEKAASKEDRPSGEGQSEDVAPSSPPRKIEPREPPTKAVPPKPKINLPVTATVAELGAALRNGDAAVEEIAAARLANLGPKAEPALYDLADALTNDNNPINVRTNAAVAIARIGPTAKKVVPSLVICLHKSKPREVRQYSAEALAQIKYPANEEAIPAIVHALENDADPQVRVYCVMSLGNLGRTKFRDCGADKALTKLLDERGETFLFSRYNAARTLAYMLRDEAPFKAVDVLLHMLRNKGVKVYHGKDVRVEEGDKPATDRKDNIGGDARFMAVQALDWLGSKAARNSDVVKALREAAKESDAKLSSEARNVLKQWKEKWHIE